MAAIQEYKTHDPNILGSIYVVGLPSLVAAAGGPRLDLTVPAVVLTGVLWVFRHRICQDDVPALLILGTLGIVYGHDLDFVYLAPLAVSLALHLQGRPAAAVVVAGLVVLFFVPARVMSRVGLPVLDQWRTVICLVFLGWVLWLSVRHAAVRSPVQSAPPRGSRCQLS
jgi:hypothetical protein